MKRGLILRVGLILTLTLLSMLLASCNMDFMEDFLNPKCEHGVKWSLVTAPTQTSSGKIKGVCVENCGYTTEEKLPVLREANGYEYRIAKAADCKNQGLGIFRMEKDGYVFEFERVLPITDHNYSNGAFCSGCNLLADGYVAISNANELRMINANLSGKYYLVKDIYLDATWTPIGTDAAPFVGILDGNGCKIFGMELEQQAVGGLFGVCNGTVCNLTLNTVYHTVDLLNEENATYISGAIAGKNNGRIFNCAVTGEVQFAFSMRNYGIATCDAPDWSYTGNYYVGGLVGVNAGTMENNRCSGFIEMSLFGEHRNTCKGNAAFLDQCQITQKVTGYFGACAGQNSGTITDFHSDATVLAVASAKVSSVSEHWSGQHNLPTVRITVNLGGSVGRNIGRVVGAISKIATSSFDKTTDHETAKAFFAENSSVDKVVGVNEEGGIVLESATLY